VRSLALLCAAAVSAACGDYHQDLPESRRNNVVCADAELRPYVMRAADAWEASGVVSLRVGAPCNVFVFWGEPDPGDVATSRWRAGTWQVVVDEDVSDAQLQGTVSHELGHVVGLGHSSGVMSPCHPVPDYPTAANLDELRTLKRADDDA